jgi:protein-disulfide isomerase
LSKKRKTYWLMALLGTLLVFAAVFLALHLAKNKSEQNYNSADIPEVGKVKGQASAPALLEVFSDFNCGHCAANAGEFEKTKLIPYLATGKMRLQYRHFLVGGIQSYAAALAAECAARQGKFWPYHDELYARFDPKRYLEYSEADVTRFRDELISLAAELGLDTTAFTNCLFAASTKEAVMADHYRGEQLQVNITPTYVLNGRKLSDEPDEIIAQINKVVGR